MTEEGYIKYSCKWNPSPFFFPDNVFSKMNVLRNRLYELDLIGVYDNNIGFGNISYNNKDGSFFITGSATGGKASLTVQDYSLVTGWDIARNYLECMGETKASSESLSHAAIYEKNNRIGCVIHVHSIKMWKKYVNILDTTPQDCEYGTPQMANAIKELVLPGKDNGILIMAGHKEGIISYGQDLATAEKIVLEHFTNL